MTQFLFLCFGPILFPIQIQTYNVVCLRVVVQVAQRLYWLIMDYGQKAGLKTYNVVCLRVVVQVAQRLYWLIMDYGQKAGLKGSPSVPN